MSYDFDKTGLGIGGAGSHDLAAEAAELASAAPEKAACIVCKAVYPQLHLSHGACPDHSAQCDFCQGWFPTILLMSASMGTACPDCYDRASD